MIRVELSCGHFAFLSGVAAVHSNKGTAMPCFRCHGHPMVEISYSPVDENVTPFPETDLEPETQQERDVVAMFDATFSDEGDET